MASQSKHKAEAQSKRQPIPDFEDDSEDDYTAEAFEMLEHDRQQQERQQ